VILGEGDIACAEKAGYDKSAWINDWMQDLEGDYSYVKFANYFSDNKVEEAVGEVVDWTPNSSAGAAASWATAMAKSWWWPDEVAPDVTDKALDQNGLLTFKAADAVSGIDWNNVKVTITDERGNAVDTPSLTYNASTGEVSMQINMSNLSSGRRYIAEIETTDNAGNSGIDPVVLKLEAEELTIQDLHNYPNPFSPQNGGTTTLVFIMTQDPQEKVLDNGTTTSNVVIRIFDAAGERVQEIWDIPTQTGLNEVEWDGTNLAGKKVSPGIYFFAVWATDNNKGERFSPSAKPGKIAVVW
jgi:flagellar hook assembly protein FlgD